MGSGTSLFLKSKSQQKVTDQEYVDNKQNYHQKEKEEIKINLQNEAVENDVEPNDEADPVVFPDTISVALETIIPFFSSNIESLEWATDDGKKLSQQLGNLCIYHNPKKLIRLSKNERIEVAKLYVEHNIPQLVHKYFIFVSGNHSDIFTKDEKIIKQEITELKSQIKSLGESNEQNQNISELESMLKFSQSVLKVQNIIGGMIMALVNSSDVHEIIGQACCEIGIIQTFMDIIHLYYPLINEEDKKEITGPKIRANGRIRIFNSILSLFHNTAKYPENQIYFDNNKCIERMTPFLKSVTAIFSMKSLLLLAYLINEENTHIILATEEPIKFLLNYLKSAIKSEKHRYMGFSLSELLSGLSKIAQNDNNKSTIGNNGGVDIIKLCLAFHLDNEEGDNEMMEACKALWILAFDSHNRELIAKDDVIMSFLRTKFNSNKALENAASGTLWEVEGKFSRSEEEMKLHQGHIMISYQWDHQDVMIKVRDKLEEQGYKVWIDIDQMGGSTLEAMAAAVEGAYLVLMTVSKKYKDSANCRSEAEYAFQLHKPIIPLMLQTSYKPDGWLGFIVGAKFWIDFTDPLKSQESTHALVKEIDKQRVSLRNSPVSTSVLNPTTKEDDLQENPDPPYCKKDEVRSWSVTDVQTWLKSISLSDAICDTVKDDLSGFVLVHLYHLYQENVDAFYRLLKKDVGLSKLSQRFQFADELKNLLQS